MSGVNGRRRVVVTGLGGITPVGNTIEETWKNIRAGKSGVSRIEEIDVPEGTPNIAGQVKGTPAPLSSTATPDDESD